MAYVAWSVVYGEQPSAAKWNILGTNDASFNDGSGIGNGAVTPSKLNNDYLFEAYASGSTTVATSETKILFATELFDLNNNFASSTYTAPATGYYYIFGQVTVSAGAANETIRANIYVNGSTYIIGARVPSDGTNQHGSIVNGLVPLTAGNTVDIYAISSAGGRGTITGSATKFGGFYVTP